MSKFRLPNILYLLWAAWLVPYYGKKVAPAVFGSGGIQWGSAVLVALLVPIAVITWWVPASSRSSRSISWAFLIGALIPVLFNLGHQAIMIPPLTRIVSNMTAKSEKDSAAIAKAREIATHGDSPEKRERVASVAYQVFGVRIEWLNDAGTTQTYTPSEKDIQRWEDFRVLNEKDLSIRGEVEWLLKQIHGLYILNLVSLGLTFLALFWRNRRSNAGNLSPIAEN